MSWRPILHQLLVDARFRTQAELAQALAERAQEVDQAAISRELKRIGAVKIDGVYRPPAAGPGLPVRRFVATAAQCLVVIATEPAYAMALGQAIDDAELEGVLGTVAGDDTVFAATTGRTATAALARWLGVSFTP